MLFIAEINIYPTKKVAQHNFACGKGHANAMLQRKCWQFVCTADIVCSIRNFLMLG